MSATIESPRAGARTRSDAELGGREEEENATHAPTQELGERERRVAKRRAVAEQEQREHDARMTALQQQREFEAREDALRREREMEREGEPRAEGET